MAELKNGFTLIELMVTLAIAAILLAVGIPGMQSLMEGSRVRTATNNILSDLLFARSQAVNLGLEVIVCPLNSSNVCDADWNLGLSIFVDENKNKQLDLGEPKIKTAEPISSSDKLSFNSSHWINFGPDGLTSNNGAFSYCTTTQEPAGITLAQSGRARIDHDAANCP